MRSSVLAATLCLTLAAATAARAQPMRVMSMNACTDLLVLQVVPRSRIVSVTYRAADAVRSYAPGSADGVPTNDGRPEEIARYRPDLVVAGRFTTAATKAMARRAGYAVLELEDATSFDDIRSNLRKLGAATGQGARAEVLVDQLDRSLAEAARRRPSAPVRTLSWSGGAFAPVRGSLADAVLRAAGGLNVAPASAGPFADFDLEALIAARPQALVQADPRYSTQSLLTLQGRHPVVRRLFNGRVATTSETLIDCGLPQTGEAAARLAGEFARIAAGGPR